LEESSPHSVWAEASFHTDVRDPVVRIEVAGRPLCFEKAKYKLAMGLGVGRSTNGFYVDRINLNAALPSQR
jgi:hypothetical protein